VLPETCLPALLALASLKFDTCCELSTSTHLCRRRLTLGSAHYAALQELRILAEHAPFQLGKLLVYPPVESHEGVQLYDHPPGGFFVFQ
jgi:hypothetical protein